MRSGLSVGGRYMGRAACFHPAGVRDRLSMAAAEDPHGILRSCQEADAADVGCIGKAADAADVVSQVQQHLPKTGEDLGHDDF